MVDMLYLVPLILNTYDARDDAARAAYSHQAAECKIVQDSAELQKKVN